MVGSMRAVAGFGVALAASLTAALASFGAGASETRSHALSLVGAPRFPADFAHFDWVDPKAPKGGHLKTWSLGSFDSLNGFTVQGNAADQLDLVHDTLMASSPDEPSTEYCHICEWVSYPADFSSVTFGLRPQAKFHDGAPLTAEDVAFSLEAQKTANPQIGFYYKNVVRSEIKGPHEITFHFDVKGNRELPQIMGQLTVLPKHFWTAKGASGEPRDLSKSTLEVPLGSGPYRVKDVDRGRSITYERVKDWWAADLPVTRGQWNFDEIRVEYFRERTPAFEAFKSGQIDVWVETSAKAWSTEYEFPAVKSGAVRKERFAVERVAPMQAFVFNLRRPQFQDARVRRAFDLAFNFEAINAQLLYSQYIRTTSYFDNSELKATGLPQGRELEILKEVEALIPPAVFTAEYKTPVGGAEMIHRRNLGEAAKLLAAAGWTLKGNQVRNAAGEPLKAELLLVSPDFERIALRYMEDLKKLGIEASVRTVDSAQYQRRRRSFDFDVTTVTFAQSISPGNEQRFFWGSEAADREGSRNAIGIKNPAVDKLIDKIIFATDRPELVAATRALDRVLLWNHYLVPQWYYPYERIVSWDRFGRPARMPRQTTALDRTWWYDATKAAALAAK